MLPDLALFRHPEEYIPLDGLAAGIRLTMGNMRFASLKVFTALYIWVSMRPGLGTFRCAPSLALGRGRCSPPMSTGWGPR